jgi:murein DD-endopeptidase MepM/ murein hydrolase activator NlpD
LSRKVTLMIVPEGGQGVFSRTIRLSLFRSLLIFLCIWIVVLVVATFFYARLSVLAVKASVLEEENHTLRGYLARVVDIEKSFKKNRELVARLAQMAGVDLEEYDQPGRINLDSALAALPDSVIGGTFFDSTVQQIPLTKEQLAKQTTPQGRPLYGWVTRTFSEGDDSGDRHAGLDFAVKRGTAVAATASGKVVFAGWDENLGNVVRIDHGNGFETVYGHNDKLLVQEGMEVLKGDVIALSGNTGYSTAPHLHYEIRKNGVPIDPTPFLD